MSKTNADFRKLVSSNKYILTPQDDDGTARSKPTTASKPDESAISDAKREEKKRKRAERKKKYFDRKKAAKEKERVQKEEEEFDRQLKTENGDYADLPEEYKRLIGGDLGMTPMVRGLDRNLLRKTREKIAKQQGEDIEDAYQQIIVSPSADNRRMHQNENENDIEGGNDLRDEPDEDGDVSMIFDIHSSWARNLCQSAMTHYGDITTHHGKKKRKKKKEKRRVRMRINPKFSNGMIYKFDLIERGSSIPTEVMRSQVGYGLVLEEFNEFEDDNTEHQICSGFTPRLVIDAVDDAMKNRGKQKAKEDDIRNDDRMNRKKRTFSEFKEGNDPKKGINAKAIPKTNTNTDSNVVANDDDDDDFDIFDDVGRDYICNPDIASKDPKRRRVAFDTPSEIKDKVQKLKESYFGIKQMANPDSNVKHAAASILKTSINKAKLEGLRLKRNNNIAENESSNLKKQKSPSSGLRGKLLSSGFSSYADDEEDVEERRAYDSDDEAEDKSNAKESEWKKIQKKLEEKPKGKKGSGSVNKVGMIE